MSAVIDSAISALTQEQQSEWAEIQRGAREALRYVPEGELRPLRAIEVADAADAADAAADAAAADAVGRHRVRASRTVDRDR
jgi:Spy/CpxP family protein refolding chaperone